MSEYVPARLRREIRQRANQHCEYCLIHEDDVLLPHEPDHIIAMKHDGATSEANLAWTCFLCNRAKGSDIASVDPLSCEIVRLFSPRPGDVAVVRTVYATVKTILDDLPRVYTTELYEQKCDVVYQHVYESYQGEGVSIYGGKEK